jgi:F420-non-reducing hydrogenase small subunit
MWPIAHDGKYKDIEALPRLPRPGVLQRCGPHQRERAHREAAAEEEQVPGGVRLLRAYRRIPALANQFCKEEIFEKAYLKNPSIQEGNTAVPTPHTKVEAGELEIPVFYKRVYKLDDVVDVDYYLPAARRLPSRSRRSSPGRQRPAAAAQGKRGRRFRTGPSATTASGRRKRRR